MKKVLIMAKRRWILLLLSLALFSIGMFLAVQPAQAPLAVLATTPINNAQIAPESLDNITLSLSRNPTTMELKTLKLAIAPSVVATLETPLTNAGILRFKISSPLPAGVSYTAELFLGKNILFSWQFETLPITGVGFGDPKLYQDIYDQDTKDYPLLIKTPYDTADYMVFYSAPMTLTIKVAPSTQKNFVQIKQEVSAWIEEQRGDPKIHVIIFK